MPQLAYRIREQWVFIWLAATMDIRWVIHNYLFIKCGRTFCLFNYCLLLEIKEQAQLIVRFQYASIYSEKNSSNKNSTCAAKFYLIFLDDHNARVSVDDALHTFHAFNVTSLRTSCWFKFKSQMYDREKANVSACFLNIFFFSFFSIKW